eukprot:2039428-Rhodomonas_salina.6
MQRKIGGGGHVTGHHVTRGLRERHVSRTRDPAGRSRDTGPHHVSTTGRAARPSRGRRLRARLSDRAEDVRESQRAASSSSRRRSRVSEASSLPELGFRPSDVKFNHYVTMKVHVTGRAGPKTGSESLTAGKLSRNWYWRFSHESLVTAPSEVMVRDSSESECLSQWRWVDPARLGPDYPC